MLSLSGILRLVSHTALVAGAVFLLWAAARLLTLWLEQKKGAAAPTKAAETLLWVFVFYMICLYQITAFRYGIHLDLWLERTSLLDGVNLSPFVNTLKLLRARNKWYFIYNLFGNILWFVPLGVLLPIVSAPKKKRGFLFCTTAGLLCSLSIELLQYLFVTGISDIDDIIFNTLGTALGYLLYLAGCAAMRWGNAAAKRRKKKRLS